jgi:hypothetical protein
LIYQSIADIYAANDRIRQRLAARVENLDEAQQHFRPSDNAWSVAQIIEHLSIIEGRMVQLLGMLLHKTESAAATASASTGGHTNADANANSPRPFKPFSFDQLAAENMDRKFDAPEFLIPTGGLSVSDSLARMQTTRAALNDLRPRLEAADTEVATYPHPAFGDLNTGQWLAFVGLHEGRHLRQIERLMDAPEFVGKVEG